MNRQEKLSEIRSKNKINCLFLNNNERVFKLDPLIKRMSDYEIFNVNITKSVHDIEKMYKDVDLYFPCQPYTYRITHSSKILQKLYEDKKLIIIKYSLGWNKSFFYKSRPHLYPNYDNSLLNFVDSPDLVLDNHYIYTGHPWSEKLLSGNEINSTKKNKKKTILICFHWTISSYGTGRNHTTLLTLGNDILEICMKYRSKVNFIFRPHQILFDLYCGVVNKVLFRLDKEEKYEKYKKATIDAREILFKISNNFPLTYDTNYIQLFRNSDAMIHDCGSYRCEYLYMNKPVAYLSSKENLDSTEWSEMGSSAMKCHELLYNKEQIENFILDVINGKDNKKELRDEHFLKYISVQKDPTPSERIIKSLIGQ